MEKNNQKSIYYKVYDDKGIFITKINSEDEKKLSNKYWLKGVSCFVLNKKGEVLVEKRNNTKLTPNELDLCSGHVDNSETETQSVVRELKEELGILENVSSNVYKISKTPEPLCFESNGKLKNFYITFYCLKIDSEKLNIQQEEVLSYTWVPLEEVFSMIQNGNTKFPKNYDYSQVFNKVREFYNGQIDIKKGVRV